MSDELKPCPFCGNAPVAWDSTDITDGYVHGTTVQCETCGIHMSEEYRSEVVSAWNRRADELAEAHRQIAELRAEAEPLVAALEPFARHAEFYEGMREDFVPACKVTSKRGQNVISLVDFRRARATLAKHRTAP